MKKAIPILSVLLCTVLLAGCSCRHQWAPATCTAPKTCSECAAAEGEALGHSWTEADCVTPKTCSRCGQTEGTALGHNWVDATCTTPKTCSVCGVAEGEALGHVWEGEATLYTAPVCAVCGAEGEPLPGYFAQNGLSVNIRPELAADYITNTYVRPDLDTKGMFLASEVRIFESDPNHRAKTGYEWRSVDITITFSDGNSGLYGTNVACARADYYQDQALNQAEKRDRFPVTYNGKEYRCITTYENAGFYSTEDSNVFHMTCYAQVPVGYDGVVLAFYHGGIDIDGMHLHEVEDENMLLCRLA